MQLYNLNLCCLQIDILVSNAGRSQRAQWENIDTEVDKQLFELNVFSLVALARKVTHHFLATGGGHHVITSSTAGKMGPPFSGSYGASKHALHVSESYIYSWRPPSLSELTPIIFNTRLTHLSSKVSSYCVIYIDYITPINSRGFLIELFI